MDPLSITLTVITFATALKDIIETANAIQDSFSKVPQNYRNGQKLAKLVFKTLQEMQGIYQEKQAIFDGTPHLRKTINDLRAEMKSVHKQCARLIPPVGERKRDRFKIAFYSFWSREKVERLISDLYDHVERCSQQFILLSSLRTEALVMEIHETLHNTVQITNSVSHTTTRNFAKVDLPHSGFSGLGSAVSNANLFEFTRSSVMPMTWIAATIPVHDLSKAYLRRELGKIDLSLQSISVRWLSQNPTSYPTAADALSEIPILTFSWFLENAPIPSAMVHQDAVMLAFRIQSLLRESPSNVWIHTVDIAINQLSLNLIELQMHEDAISICTLRVDLWRAIAARNPSPTSSRRLVDALMKLSVVLSNMGNRSQTYLVSTEAIDILQSLVALGEQVPNVRLRVQDIEQLARSMILQAESDPDANKAPQLAVDAGKMLENALGLDDLSTTDISALSSNDWPAISSSVTSSAMVFHRNISDDTRFTYASSLLRIAQVQLTHHQSVTSNKYAKMSLAILNHLLAKYPGSDKIQEGITRALTHLSDVKIRTLNTAAENLQYMERNIALIRRLGQINPQRYVIPLARALWTQRDMLLVLGNADKAQTVYQEMVSLNELAAAPPHFDFKIPSQTEGDYYAQIALWHYTTLRFTDAIYAAQNAISQYSALEFMEPERSRAKHISAVALLCKSLTSAHQCETALSEGFKALKAIDNINIYSAEADYVESYRDLLGALMGALEGSSDPLALTRAEDINARIRKLTHLGRLRFMWKSAEAPVNYAKLLQKNGRIEEAVTYLEEMRKNWGELFEDLEDTVTTVPYIQCLNELPQMLQKKGETDKALDYNEKGITFTEKSLGDAPDEFKSVVLRNMKSRHVYLLCDAGRYPEAMKLSQEMASDVRKDPQRMRDPRTVIQALFGVALTQLYNCLPLDAIATGKDAVSYCQKLEKDYPHKCTLLYVCSLSISNGYTDLGNVDEAIKHFDDAENAILRQYKAHSIEELEHHKSTYSALLIRRSRLLFSKGDYVQAANLVKKVEAIERTNSKIIPASLKDLANILIYSGILFCTLGRHEEGNEAATELKKLQEDLSVTSPALARLIKVGLTFLSKRGAWKPVKEARDKLKCGHQDSHPF